jgi:hypothetical protein
LKNRKWFIIIVISLVLIAFEVASVFILILPGMNKNKMFEALREGKGDEASDYYDRVKYFAAQDIQEDIKGFMVTETNAYLSGSGSYENFISRIRAVEKIADFKGSSFEYVKTANMTQLRGLFEKGYSDQVLNSGDNLFDIWDDFDDVYYIYDKNGKSLADNYGNKADEYYEYINDGLDDCLKDKYNQYKAGTIDAAAITAYTEVALEFFVDTEYTGEVHEEISQIAKYEKELAVLQSMLDEKLYYDAIDQAAADIEAYSTDQYFGDYKDDFQSIYDKAYSEGKEDGLAKAKAAAEAGDKKEAREKIAELKEIFGEDVDTSAIEDMLVPDWAKAYIAFMDDLPKNFKAAMEKGPEQYIIAGNEKNAFTGATKNADYDTSNLEIVTVYDIDKNGTPELILGSNNEKSFHYVFTWNGKEVSVLMTIGHILGFGDKGYVVSKSYTDSSTEEEVLTEYLWYVSGTEASIKSITIYTVLKDEDLYLVDSNTSEDKVDKEKYDEALAKIEEQIKTDLPDCAAIGDYKNYLVTYEE